MLNCPNCATENADNAIFCKHCFTFFNGEPSETTAATAPPDTDSKATPLFDGADNTLTTEITAPEADSEETVEPGPAVSFENIINRLSEANPQAAEDIAQKPGGAIKRIPDTPQNPRPGAPERTAANRADLQETIENPAPISSQEQSQTTSESNLIDTSKKVGIPLSAGSASHVDATNIVDTESEQQTLPAVEETETEESRNDLPAVATPDSLSTEFAADDFDIQEELMPEADDTIHQEEPAGDSDNTDAVEHYDFSDLLNEVDKGNDSSQGNPSDQFSDSSQNSSSVNYSDNSQGFDSTFDESRFASFTIPTTAETSENSGSIPRWPGDEESVKSPPQSSPLNKIKLGGQNSRMMIIGALAIAAVIVIGYVVMHWISNQDYSQERANALYSLAEKLYEQQDFSESLKFYQLMAAEFPESPLTPIARRKIDQIYKNHLPNNPVATGSGDPETLVKVGKLLLSARAAIARNQILRPEGQSAHYFINEILSAAPENNDALMLQDSIVSYYADLASQSLDNGNLKEARQYYENILQILPGDEFTHEQLAYIDYLGQNKGKPTARQPVATGEPRNRLGRLALNNNPPPRRKKTTGRNAPAPTARSANTDKPLTPEAERIAQETRIAELRQQRQSYLENIQVENREPQSEPRNRRPWEIDVPVEFNPNEVDPANPVSFKKTKIWNGIKRHLQEDVDIIKENNNFLVLFHSSLGETLTIAREKSADADIYSGSEQVRGGNPYQVWVKQTDNLNSPLRPDEIWHLFFSAGFIRELR